MQMENEFESLNKISQRTTYSTGANISMVEYTHQILNRHITGKNILELGPAEGVMTDLLVKDGRKVTVVEGAKIFCDAISMRHPSVQVHNCLFEEHISDEKYDGIILGHVLEHVEDPISLLKKVGNWLSHSGKIFAAVPNCRSLHRQAAVIMGLLDKENELNESDILHGHRRVFSPEEFLNSFSEAGLNVEVFGGYWLKPVSNKQIETTWTPEMLQAFLALGERYPDIAAEIYIVANKLVS